MLSVKLKTMAYPNLNAIVKVCLTLLICICLTYPIISQAQLNSSVDRQEISQDDIFSFTLTSDKNLGSNARPDLNSLKQDFDILSTSSSSQVSIINGRSTTQMKWHFQLAPKKTGKLVIPPIKVGNDYSQAITLNVLTREQADNSRQYSTESTSNSELLKLELLTHKNEVYVQEEIQLTIRITHSMPIYSIDFDYPGVSDAIAERLGDGKQYTSMVDGRQVRVYEIKWVIYPLTPGELIIPETKIIAEIPDTSVAQQRSQRQSAIDRMFGRNSALATKRVRRGHDALNIKIKPIPDQFPADQPWLPATQVKVDAMWSPSNPPNFLVGEPISRTLTMNVLGQHPNFIPELDLPNIDGFKVYPDTPKGDAQVRSQTLLGFKTLSYTFIPTSEGEKVIPEQVLYWWNTNVDQLQKIELPSMTVPVNPNASIISSSTDLAANQSGNNIIDEENTSSDSISSEKSQEQEETPPLENDTMDRTQSGGQDISYYFYLGITLLIVIPLLFFICLLIYRKVSLEANNPDKKGKKPLNQAGLKKMKTQLYEACHNDDLHSIKQHLLDWSNALIAHYNHPANPCHSLEDIKTYFNNDMLSEAINQLQKALYATKPLLATDEKNSETPHSFIGQQIKTALMSLNTPEKEHSKTVDNETLKSLYGK